jgi:hypothetical protein
MSLRSWDNRLFSSSSLPLWRWIKKKIKNLSSQN